MVAQLGHYNYMTSISLPLLSVFHFHPSSTSIRLPFPSVFHFHRPSTSTPLFLCACADCFPSHVVHVSIVGVLSMQCSNAFCPCVHDQIKPATYVRLRACAVAGAGRIYIYIYRDSASVESTRGGLAHARRNNDNTIMRFKL